eukprot:GHRQ01037730.1.p4 GENE.GHRQ01037730.1~~GHRQ01037730.1.p4  ORF type:complete len:105 (+),score=46.04 GHRQ01037730.1:161-475(+)
MRCTCGLCLRFVTVSAVIALQLVLCLLLHACSLQPVLWSASSLLRLGPTCCVLQVLQEMLDMLRDHENNHHSARLEWIVIYLIMVEVVVGLLEVLGLFGLVGSE